MPHFADRRSRPTSRAPDAVHDAPASLRIAAIRTVILDIDGTFVGHVDGHADTRPKALAAFEVIPTCVDIRAQAGEGADLAGIDRFVDGLAGADDICHLKPRPDRFAGALGKVGDVRPADARTAGGTPWDAIGAVRAGMRVIGPQCGGVADDVSRAPGCDAVDDDPRRAGAGRA